ncbi:hypothetical protein ABT071_36610 [Streptomyces sp. NPDC002506]|uniref:hypothetical protein n=1 Tax=Streptomyces sp. NPDC002506 TaxID=3154536 RepID=UPI00332006D5
MEPAGFSRDAFLPAYGLAENTRAATGADVPVVLVRPHRASLRIGEGVTVQEEIRVRRPGRVAGPGSGRPVGHGAPRPGDDLLVRASTTGAAPAF